MNGYVWLYKRLMPRRYANYLQRANGNVDMCHETLLHGTFYEEYRAFDFANKSQCERRQWLTDAVRDRLCRRVNSHKGELTVADKWLTYKQFEKYYGRQMILLDGAKSTAAAARMGMAAGRLVAKQPRSSGGRGVELLQAQTESQWLTLLGQRQHWVVEECIEQAPSMAAWNKTSVNTLRVNLFTNNGEVQMAYPCLRTGRQGQFVDNGAQGGVFASVDAQTGIITTDGFDENGTRYISHPDSHVPYKGSQIEQWAQLLAMVKDLTISGMNYISWDIALTPDGWVVVEANRGEFIMQQISLQTGLLSQFEQLCGLPTKR